MKRRTVGPLALCLVLLLWPDAALSQRPDALAGRWEWKGSPDKNKAHTEFSIWFERKGDVVSGTYSVDDFVNGEWQGEDGNKTPYRGEVRGGTIVVEFDPAATVPGTEEDVTYKAPSDGRKPSTATLTIKGDTIEWAHTSGDRIEGIPVTLTLKHHPPKGK